MRLDVKTPSPIDASVKRVDGIKVDDGALPAVSGLGIDLNYYNLKDSPVGLILIVVGSDNKMKDRCIVRVSPQGKLKLERRLDQIDPQKP
jgi:hypothetical protein